MKTKHIVAILLVLILAGVASSVFAYFAISAHLPRLITVKDYHPLLLTEVYSADGQKIGEFYREKRIIIPYDQIPKRVVEAFISAEDAKFFEHGGINFTAIIRATFADLRAGHSVQGGSTITQQVAKSLMLTREKTLIRKVKEAILAFRMERYLSKQDILYLYLNQIYLGHGVYGVEAASETYFHKHVGELSLAESAILAGLPQAPQKYSPVLSPRKAKERQVYVLNRMAEEGYITRDEAKQAINEPLKVFVKDPYEDIGPAYRETVRQFLVQDLGEDKVLNEGIRVYTAMNLKKQMAAQDALQKNLRDLDKRQGYRGPLKTLTTAKDVAEFLAKERDDLILDSQPYRIINPDGQTDMGGPLDLTKKTQGINVPTYLKMGQIVDGVVTKVDSALGLVTVRFAEAQGLIDLDDMSWARKPDVTKHMTEDVVKDPAKVLSVGDVIQVRIKDEKFTSPRLMKLMKAQTRKHGKKAPPLQLANLPNFSDYAALALEQEPKVEAALLSFDLTHGDVVAMVGGNDFEKSEFNRAIQAARQTGSAFKPVVYAAALEKGFTPASVIIDSPLVYEEESENKEGQTETHKWKPSNFENKFIGDVLMRTALIKSMNVPTVKLLENVGLDFVKKYAERLGIFSPLNSDYTMALGSSSVTLYEMVKAYAIFARAGRRIHPILIKKVTDFSGKNVLLENVSLDDRFKKELDALEALFPGEPASSSGASVAKAAMSAAEKGKGASATGHLPLGKADGITGRYNLDGAHAFDFADPEQRISPQIAYLITHLLKGVVLEGTGWRARALGRPSAGKTGTTSNYNDAWYIGYTPHIVTGVWMGYDNEKPLGKFETGNASALPAWVDYMKVATEDTPASDFPVPPGIVFANIDAATGKLASPKSKKVVREAFLDRTEPTESTDSLSPSDEKDFFKEDMSN